jgi:DNA-binding NarL/FixJ family response regulator
MVKVGKTGLVTIVLAEDHHIVRRGLRAFLQSEPDFRIIGEASDGLEAAEVVERLQPDVLVLDMVMPTLNGLEVIQRVRRYSPKTRVVVLSMYENEAYVVGALRAGAKAYVLKRSTSEELVHAVREATAGGLYLSPHLAERAIQAYIDKTEDTGGNSYGKLTAREREVLQLTAEGHTSSQIAERLYISRRTAETHRANIMRKLGLRTQTDLIRYALRQGILPPET